MIIGDFKVLWRESGYTWARPVIFVRKEYKRWFRAPEMVWTEVSGPPWGGGWGMPEPRREVLRFDEASLKRWLQKAVDEYEAYLASEAMGLVALQHQTQ